MYQTENFTGRIAMEDYNKDYVNSDGFLNYCRDRLGYERVWACPQYDFDPEDYWREYKYFHIIGTRVVFDLSGSHEEIKSDGIRKSMKQACLKEKDFLWMKLKKLEKKYPGSLGLSAGSCHMCSQCTKPRRGGCRYPDEIRYLLEAMEGSLGRTAGEILGQELQWAYTKPWQPFTLITGLLSDHYNVEL